jgi:hypothetical protein
MRFLFLAAVAGAALNAGEVVADCSCLCLDGAYRPVCTSAEEVGQNRGLCLALASQSCPEAPEVDGLTSYAAPVEGVENCRQTQVFDGNAGDFVAARVCDVVPTD